MLRRGALLMLALGTFAVSFVVVAAAAPARSFRTAVYVSDGPDRPAELARIRGAGANVARITMYWTAVAPASKPAQWDPSNPADPNYHWDPYDAKIRDAVRHGLEPLVTIMAAPQWAQGSRPVPSPNSYLPDPASFGQFATAAATRYSGSFGGLPRVRMWQAWNEPNLSIYLIPQLKGRPISPGWYRQMLNAFAAAVHAVHSDNVVAVGGLAPFRDITPSVLAQDSDWGPLSFMRELLCLSPTLQPTCTDVTTFDAWATHPYTSGGPMHKAVLPNDVSLGDLPKMRQVLDAAMKAGHVKSTGPVKFWVTEFSWDSSPPDPCSPPMSLLSRWIPEAFYRMWANRVDLVVWLALQDNPMTTSYFQSGFYFASADIATAQAKPTLEGFRFPFVAFRQGNRVYVWARTPRGAPARLVVEQRTGRKWKKVVALTTGGTGIMQKTLKARPIGDFRARMFPSNETSLPFSMKVPPDRFFNPFGEPALLEPGGVPSC